MGVVVIVVFLAMVALMFLALAIVLGVVIVSAVKDRRAWRGPGLTPAEWTHPSAELQDPAAPAGPPSGEDGALAAWNMAQFRNHQAGDGTPIGPF
jgi:hypothetical protein